MSPSPTLKPAVLAPSPSLPETRPSRDGSPRIASPLAAEQSPEPDPSNAQAYVKPDDGQLKPPASFLPFFTVVEDTSTGEHYHPAVHYIFSDDDHEILTAAAVRELGYDDSNEPPRDDDGSDATITLLPPTRPGVKERYVVLDVSIDGHTITDIQSMSKEWQAQDTVVRPAPTWDEETDSAAGALMLKVNGVEINHPSSSKPSGADVLKHVRQETANDLLVALDTLADRFEVGLGATAGLVEALDHERATEQQTDS